MKKRVLSALLVLCMACSMVSTVWATETNATSGAPEPASQTLNLDNEQPGDESGADSTGAPSDSTDSSTSASSDSTSSGSSSAASDAASDATSGEGDESAASSDSTAASDSTSSSSSASSDSADGEGTSAPSDSEEASQPDGTTGEGETGEGQENASVTETTDETKTGNVYFIFEKLPQPETIDTADTEEIIGINLFNYDKSVVKDGNNNVLGNFDFGASGDRDENQPWNSYSSGNEDGAYQGIMKKLLEGNYPAFNTNLRESGYYGERLGDNAKAGARWLFSDGAPMPGKTAYTGLNHLFTYNEAEHKYSYDSASHFASIVAEDPDKGNTGTDKNFVVYENDANNSGGNSVKFAPFNTLDGNNNLVGSADYLFGMSIDFAFMQPEDGKIQLDNGETKDMTFTFNGDDDVWVYIDGVLVLDIGGIHGAVEGTINFSTGEVYISKVKGAGYYGNSGSKTVDLMSLYKEAQGADFDESEWVETEKGYHRFADYSDHTLNFYYLERGEGSSNCKIEFNMPTIPKNAVAVTKNVTGDVPENAPEAYTMQFVPESWPTTEPGEEIKAGTSEETAKTLSASDAAFTVTPGTPTYIYNVPSNLAYQIKEIEVDEGVSVSFNGTAATPDQGVAVSEMFDAGTRSVTVTNNYPLEPVTPEHRKYVERNEDGTYDLTLDVTGMVNQTEGEVQKIDILYVLDNSGSMDYIMYDENWHRIGTRRKVAQDAITALEDDLKEIAYPDGNEEPAALDIEHSLILFESSAEVETQWKPITNKLDLPYRSKGGTNYDSAINAAIRQMGNQDPDRADAINVVIFISDGDPDPGHYDGYDEIEKLDLGENGYFYAIGVSNDVSDATLNGLITHAEHVKAENKRYVIAQNSTDLTSAFEGLVDEILSADVSNVTITDTLSQYAQLTENATFTVNVEGADGVTISPSSFSIAQARERASGRISYTRDGEPVSVGFTVTYTPAVAATATEAAVPASFTLDFDDDSYTLENGWTYSITTQIEPTDAAYDCYRDNGYPNTGEADTDAPGVAEENYISEGKQGFFSNQSAILTYNSADHTGITVDYNNPVIQIPEPSTTTLTLSKTFHGLTDDEVNYLIFREDGFGYDVNYCQPEVRDDAIISNNTITRVFATYMADADAVKGVTLRTGEAVTGGGDFKVVANDYLTVGSNAVTGIQNIVDNYNSEYTNEQTGASLVKDSNSGDWTLTIVMDVPVASDGYYYTVFEQHGEVPGYAKLDDSTVEYQISGEIQFIDDNGGLVSLTDANDDGTGKFVDVGVAAANNVYIDMDTEITNVQVEVEDAQYAHQNGDSNIYTISGEEAGVHNGSFSRLHITGATTIHFDNYYTGDLVVTKAVTGIPTSDEAAQTELADKEFTLEFTPVLIDQKPVVRGDLLEGREITYTITDANGTVTNPATQGNEFTTHMDNSGAFTVTIQVGQTITFKEIPAIQYTVTEQTTGVEYDLTDYTWQSVSYAETAANFNKGGVDHATDTYWNHNGMNGGDRVSYDVIGAATTGAETDQIVSVHSDIADPRPSQTLTVTNEYKHIDVTLTVSKTVLGNLGDKTKDFAFTLIVTPAEGQTLDYSAIAETIEITSLDEGETSQPTYTFTNGSVQFQMHSGQQMTVQLPYGCNYAVSEVTDGYSAQIDVTGDSDANQDGVKVSGTMDADIKVAYTNTMVVGVPTGLDRNNTPYTLMVTAAGVAGLALIGAVVNRRIRRRREE